MRPDQDDNLSKASCTPGGKASGVRGIGTVEGKELEDSGIDKACVVPGQFWGPKKDEDLFWE